MTTYRVVRTGQLWLLTNSRGAVILCADDRATAIELAKAVAKAKKIDVPISDGQSVEEIVSFRDGVEMIIRCNAEGPWPVDQRPPQPALSVRQ